ncbi:acyltransferase [Pedobacter sp. L105]|uniref:acyltransferase family protein n=1 Tax=Pedobacter sp. L105 TaxID=1641871 RepID=UPI00131C5121|nr:hypothetical protein [Pedobacter sp. L105]
MHAPADNPVFWTLRIEAEYYIFIGLFFVLLTQFPKLSIIIGVPVLLLLSQTLVINYTGFFNFIVYFLIGTIGYLIYIKEENTILEYLALAVSIAFSFVFYELAAGIVATLTILVILYFRKPVSPVLEFPGEISYSLYLLHFPLGTKLINLLQRHISPSLNWALFIFATLVCFGVAWLFWQFIEKPSARLSSAVKYGNAKTKFENFSLKS